MKPQSSLIAHGGTIKIVNPGEQHRLRGRAGHRHRQDGSERLRADAPGYILGYTAGNDVSDRVLQRKDGQWIRAKGFDTYCPLGPCIETEIDPGDAQDRIAPQRRRSGSRADLGHDL